MSFDDSAGELDPKTLRAIKTRAEVMGDTAHAEAILALKDCLPFPQEVTPIRIGGAWLMSMRGFSEFYEQIRGLSDKTEIALMRGSRPIGKPITAGNTYTNTLVNFVGRIVQGFLHTERDAERALGEMVKVKSPWHIEVPSVMVPGKSRLGRVQPDEKLRWQPSRMVLIADHALGNPKKQTEAIIKLARALVDKRRWRELEQARKRERTLAYPEAKQEILSDPLRAAEEMSRTDTQAVRRRSSLRRRRD